MTMESSKNVYKGFILTQKEETKRNNYTLIFSGVCKSGPFRLIITDSRPLFFIKQEDSLPERFVPHEKKAVNLKTFDSNPVNALYFNSKLNFYTAFSCPNSWNEIRRRHIRFPSYKSRVYPKQ